ncbi:Gldg family protein [Catenovulum sp. SM1970]|uniref:Gldg family protein n=1 Tax=Marinifaba aquimaris TaxID=2741323 RepID=UPI0015724FAA|nr:Gldg family protein [Marinifaba aquimaris]NTS77614.1 Gldg family protein [Marinifaba aquimaris]
MKKLQSTAGLGALALIFLGLVLINNLIFDKARIDLTENNIYSISSGSKAIVDKIDEQVNLYYFFSDKTSEGIPNIRNYANRVQNLLEEYALASNGKIKLHIIDPEPFSEAEDRAASFGLTAVTVGAAGDSLYFGLGATNSVDTEVAIPFFDPAKEEFLEYDISQLIYKLSDTDKVNVGIISSLPYMGDAMAAPMTRNPNAQPAWVFYDQLSQMYEVEDIGEQATALPDNLDVLILAHPKNLSESMALAIDQYVMKGGNLIVFADPHAEFATASAQGNVGKSSSDFAGLLKGWGIKFDANQVVLDAATSLEIRLPTGGTGKHYGYLGLTTDNIDKSDVAVSSLNLLNGASFGFFEKAEGASFDFYPLIHSSTHTGLIDADTYGVLHDPRMLGRQFKPTEVQYTLAARVSGQVQSAFKDQSVELVDGQVLVTENLKTNIILVADTDVLADSLWVQKQNFFGQTILNPFANNGDFLANSIENLAGSSDLISIRARGKFSRPFDVVQDITAQAEERFREQEQMLQKRLEDTEKQLQELSNQNNGELVLNDEQRQALEDFQAQKLEIRKELREVRHQLDKDIDALGSKLKFINIALIPLLLTLLLAFISRKLLAKRDF